MASVSPSRTGTLLMVFACSFSMPISGRASSAFLFSDVTIISSMDSVEGCSLMLSVTLLSTLMVFVMV